MQARNRWTGHVQARIGMIVKSSDPERCFIAVAFSFFFFFFYYTHGNCSFLLRGGAYTHTPRPPPPPSPPASRELRLSDAIGAVHIKRARGGALKYKQSKRHARTYTHTNRHKVVQNSVLKNREVSR